MSELQALADMQDQACDPINDEDCDLTAIIEALQGLSEIDDPFE